MEKLNENKEIIKITSIKKELSDDDLLKIKEYSKFMYDCSAVLIEQRKQLIKDELSSETKIKDLEQLSKQTPFAYYYFDLFNVKIFINIFKRSNNYTVCCKNWQPNSVDKKYNRQVYRGSVCYGNFENINDAIKLWFKILDYFINQRLNELGITNNKEQKLI